MSVFKRITGSVKGRLGFSASGQATTPLARQLRSVSKRERSRLMTLPEELLVLVFCELCLKDIISLSHVCSRLLQISYAEVLWECVWYGSVNTFLPKLRPSCLFSGFITTNSPFLRATSLYVVPNCKYADNGRAFDDRCKESSHYHPRHRYLETCRIARGLNDVSASKIILDHRYKALSSCAYENFAASALTSGGEFLVIWLKSEVRFIDLRSHLSRTIPIISVQIDTVFERYTFFVIVAEMYTCNQCKGVLYAASFQYVNPHVYLQYGIVAQPTPCSGSMYVSVYFLPLRELAREDRPRPPQSFSPYLLFEHHLIEGSRLAFIDISDDVLLINRKIDETSHVTLIDLLTGKKLTFKNEVIEQAMEDTASDDFVGDTVPRNGLTISPANTIFSTTRVYLPRKVMIKNPLDHLNGSVDLKRERVDYSQCVTSRLPVWLVADMDWTPISDGFSTCSFSLSLPPPPIDSCLHGASQLQIPSMDGIVYTQYTSIPRSHLPNSKDLNADSQPTSLVSKIAKKLTSRGAPVSGTGSTTGTRILDTVRGNDLSASVITAAYDPDRVIVSQLAPSDTGFQPQRVKWADFDPANLVHRCKPVWVRVTKDDGGWYKKRKRSGEFEPLSCETGGNIGLAWSEVSGRFVVKFDDPDTRTYSIHVFEY